MMEEVSLSGGGPCDAGPNNTSDDESIPPCKESWAPIRSTPPSPSPEISRLAELEEEQDQLNSSLLALTTHFAQVQFRLQQIGKADPNTKEILLKELEEFAFKGCPDISEVKRMRRKSSSNEDISGVEREANVEKQRARQIQLIGQLRDQLEDLESFAYEAGDGGVPSNQVLEKQKVIIDQLKQGVGFELGTFETLSHDDLQRQVDIAIKRLVNPMKVKEQLVNQLQTQITDLERFIEFLQIEGQQMPCSCDTDPTSEASKRCFIHNRTSSTSFGFEQRKKVDKDGEHAASTLLLLQGYLMSQLGCQSRKFKKNEMKASGRANHWGDLRASLEVAVDGLLTLMERHKYDDSLPAVLNPYNSDESEVEDVFESCHEEVVTAVRKDLCPALRELLMHGLIDPSAVARTAGALGMFGCLPNRSQPPTPHTPELANPMAPQHAWDIIFKYYDMKHGREFTDQPVRKLSQSFNLENIGGRSVTSKQMLLSTIDNILTSHTKLKRSNDAMFKAFVSAALNMGSLKIFEPLFVCDMGTDPVSGQVDIVSALEGCGNNLIIGTESGCISVYSVTETVLVDGKSKMEAERWMSSRLSTEKPITSLVAASALDRIVAVSDGSLFLLTLSRLEHVWTWKVKGITCLAVNSHPNNENPFIIQLALGSRKKCIYICDIGPEKVESYKQIPTDNVPIVMALSANCICYGTSSQYYVLSIDQSSQHDLDPGIKDENKCLQTVSKEEFVLSWMPGMAVLANGGGSSSKAPVVWGDDNALDIAVLDPYVLVLRHAFLTVYDLVQQEVKQTVSMNGGRLMRNVDGLLYVATKNQLYRLVSMSWEKQIMALASEKKIEEAMRVAETALQSGYSTEEFFRTYQRLRQQSVFIQLQRGNLDEATSLVLDSQIDIREIIALFPSLLPRDTLFVKCYPPLHHIPCISAIELDQTDLRLWLMEVLGLIRQRQFSDSFKKDIDTALVKLLASESVQDLDKYLEKGMNYDFCDVEESLKTRNLHHAYATVLLHNAKYKNAFNLWRKLEKNEVCDENYPGIQVLITNLMKCPEKLCILEFGAFVMSRDETEGSTLFLSVLDRIDDLKLSFQEIYDVVKPYPGSALRVLEKIVLVLKCKDPIVHNHLASLYLSLISSTNECDSVKMLNLRKTFRKFLVESPVIDAKHVLEQAMQLGDMPVERAYIMGKLGDLEGTFEVLVKELMDFDAAEEFCQAYVVNKCMQTNCNTWLTLLKAYTQFKHAGDLPVSRIINLVNREDSNWDLNKALALIPGHWSYSLIGPFIKRNVGRLVVDCNVVSLNRGLAQATIMDLQVQKHNITSNNPVVVHEETKCCICNDVFMEPSVQVYPTGAIVHVGCATHSHLCPKTNKVNY